MLTITRRDLDEAYGSLRDAHSYIQQYKQGGERTIGQVVQSVEVAAGALAVGVASGAVGPLQVQGVPVPLDLLGGLAGHTAAFFGLAGKYSEHLHNFSDGVIAGYLTKWGIGLGTEMRRKAGKPPVSVVAGEFAYDTSQKTGYPQFGAAAPLTEAELASLAHGAERR